MEQRPTEVLNMKFWASRFLGKRFHLFIFLWVAENLGIRNLFVDVLIALMKICKTLILEWLHCLC